MTPREWADKAFRIYNSDPMATHADVLERVISEAIEEAKKDGYRLGLEHAASIAEANMHEGPFDPTEALDRVASYSNSTCKLIAAQIRSRGSKHVLNFGDGSIECPADEVLKLARAFLDAWYRAESNRGCYSCCEAHDVRCLISRGVPDAQCECGRVELEAAAEALERSLADRKESR